MGCPLAQATNPCSMGGETIPPLKPGKARKGVSSTIVHIMRQSGSLSGAAGVNLRISAAEC